MTHTVVWTAAAIGSLLLLPPLREQTLPDVMTRSIAAYAALTSYSDTGTVEIAAPGLIDRATSCCETRE